MNQERVMESILFVLFFDAIVCGFLGLMIGGRNQAAGGGFLLGFLLGPLGVIISLGLDGRGGCPHCGGKDWRINKWRIVVVYRAMLICRNRD